MFISHSDGRSFHVKFFSHLVENKVNKTVRETTCKLATVDESKTGKDRYDTVTVGTACQNSKDQDSRPKGQKTAFGKAISIFPKEERIKMWRQFNPDMKLEGATV